MHTDDAGRERVLLAPFDGKGTPMRSFDLVAFDLDGTVYVEHAKTIRPRVISAFEAAHEAGVVLAAATGRPFGMLGPSLRDAPWLEWAITVNGACVSNARTGEIVSARTMPVAQVQDVVEVVRGVGGTAGQGGWSLFAPNISGFDAELSRHKFADRGAEPGNRTNFSFVENALASGQEVEEIPSIDEALAALGTEVFKVGCMFDTEEQTQEAIRLLNASEAVGGLELALVGPTELEITRAGVTKGSALDILCAHLGIDVHRAVAFGDSGNDITFGESPCTFVAMGNATPEIKGVADEECPADKDDGVAVWLEQHL